jgi:hypothetical protein
MNRITSFLALSAIVVAGAFAGTAAQASATNVNVNFKIHNADASTSMLRYGSIPTSISGLINPAASILPGGDDPASGFAVFSAPAPNVNGFVQASVAYSASDGMSSLCTFSITVTHTALATYVLHFGVSPSSGPCSVPGDATNSTGQFTSQTYVLNWST